MKNILRQKESKNNIRIGKYEIKMEINYGIVKNLEKSSYFRFKGKAYQYLLQHIDERGVENELDQILKCERQSNEKSKIVLKIAYKNYFNKLVCVIPHFFKNSVFIMITILLMLIIGSLFHYSNIIPSTYTNGNAAVRILALMISAIFHEVGHMYLCLTAGRQVKAYGFKLNYGIPMFFVDTSDICMASKEERILTSLGGIYFNSIIGVTFAVLFLLLRKWIFYEFVSISFLFVVSNIIPFLKLDGYYVITDLLEINNLEKNAKDCLKEVVKDIRGGTVKELFLAIYYVFNSIFKLLIMVGIIIFVCNKFAEL